MLSSQGPLAFVSPLPYGERPHELQEPKTPGSSGHSILPDGFLLPFPQLRRMLRGKKGNAVHRARPGVPWGWVGVAPQVFRRAPRRPLTRPGSALWLWNWRMGTTFPSGLKPPPLPRLPPREEEARPAFASKAGQTGACPGPDPRSPALRLRPRAAASPDSIPSPFFPVGLGADLGPPSPVSPLLSFFPPPPLLCVSDSGAGP